MSGWLPASISLHHAMLVRSLQSRQVRMAARPHRRGRAAPRHKQSSPCRRPWVQRAATRGAACASPRRWRIARPRGPGPTITAGYPEWRRAAARSLARRHPTRRSAGPARAPPRRSGGTRSRPCGDNRPIAAADAVAAVGVASLSPGAALVEHQHQAAIGEMFADAEGVDLPHRLDAQGRRRRPGRRANYRRSGRRRPICPPAMRAG